MDVEVHDKSYKTGKRTVKVAVGVETSVVLNLSKQHGWYDFMVRETGAKTEAHYAGRVEIGRSSFSDPLMGDVI
jgi:phospholipase C